MSGRKRTWEAISFELVMTMIAMIALVIIIAPSLVVLIVSFTSGFSLRFPPPGYSLRWYAELWNAWQLHFAVRNFSTISLYSGARSMLEMWAASMTASFAPGMRLCMNSATSTVVAGS